LHPYRSSYIQYFLDNSDFTLIVDRNHIYPPTEAGAQTARNNWATVRNSIFEVLKAFPNSPRVMVELINEYISTDFYTRMQSLVTEIRSAGYTNPIVVSKFSQPWTTINDPLGKTYQGYHYYFNGWSPTGAISNIKIALSKGIKLINTEVGADYREKNYFTTATVDELESYLTQCVSLGVGNNVWMNENLGNWPRYQQLGFKFPTISVTSPIITTPPPATITTFDDGFEYNNLNSWSSTVKTSGETATVSTAYPHHGKYHAIFTTTGNYYSRENAYLTKNVNMQETYASGYFRITSGTTTTQILSNDGDKLYVIQLSGNSGYIAIAGIIRQSGVSRWLLYAGGTSTSSAISISTNRWYDVELHWNPTTHAADMYVDGTKILSRTYSSSAQVTSVEMGIINTYSIQNPLQIYGDCLAISNKYIPVEQ
jgi:hypothetical protein